MSETGANPFNKQVFNRLHSREVTLRLSGMYCMLEDHSEGIIVLYCILVVLSIIMSCNASLVGIT